MFTFERFILSVYKKVDIEVGFLPERFVTVFTFERFILNMCKEVGIEAGFLSESFVTQCAFVRLFSSMYKKVGIEGGFLPERFVTLCAFVRLFSCVRFLVSFYICIRKQFSTFITLGPFLPFMCFQTRLILKDLITICIL